MKSLKITSAALLLTLFAVSASAQPQQQQRRAPQGGGERPTAEKIAETATDKLDQKLELTDAQESKIYAINLKYAQEREAKMEEMKAEREAKKAEKANETEKAEKPEGKREGARRGGAPAEMKEKKEAAQDDRKAQLVEIMSVLTDEQKIDYALMLSQAKQGPKGPQQGKQGGQGGQGQQGPKGGEQEKGRKPEGEPRQ
ncbi:MAG: Spy/CpxP family protein refolding chaperone [Rikenellaceae bacterium]